MTGVVDHGSRREPDSTSSSETGVVDHCDLDSAQTRRASDQTSLSTYDDNPETFVSIVNSVNDQMEAAVDEHDDRLAPSNELLGEWIEERDRLRADGTDYTTAHNRAFNAVNYRRRFLQEIEYEVFHEYAERSAAGETIVFVCYCSNGCKCHRTIVKEHVYNCIDIELNE